MLAPGAKWIAVVSFLLAATRYPTVVEGEAFARDMLATAPASAMEQVLARTPDTVPAVLRNFGSALMTGDAALRARVEAYLSELALLRARRVDATKFSPADVRMVVSFALVDPERFRGDAAFRARVTPLLPRALDPKISSALRHAALRDLNAIFRLDFDTVETIAAQWGSIARRSSEWRVPFDGNLRMPDDVSGPIETSIYSINSQFFQPAEARTFLAAVRASAPKRRLVVLADAAMKDALRELDVEVIETFSRPYTPWPRDPFTVARATDGSIVLVNRPNLQPEREEDANMVRALAQGTLDARWTVAPIPFHNGHILLTPDAMWISIHTVEIRALQLLGMSRVPVQTFGTKQGIETYLAAVRQAADELSKLYGKPVRFVHPLEADAVLMRRLGGGGGFDLDSIVTVLPGGHALVGDLSLGAKLQRGLQNAPLQTFLDTVAAHLAKEMKVQRLPLILLAGKPKPYLVTWNNVVLEGRRAEGFASPLPQGDQRAREAFRAAGYELVLFPPLMPSVRLSGGYRCASNHVRP
ncbi:MAG TPA: hypothetical protein VHL59_09350 [Thermoanaerobaculia bacterium]|nr:hypothetical protein [Thermoanaerobaculia bacterium]